MAALIRNTFQWSRDVQRVMESLPSDMVVRQEREHLFLCAPITRDHLLALVTTQRVSVSTVKHRIRQASDEVNALLGE